MDSSHHLVMYSTCMEVWPMTSTPHSTLLAQQAHTAKWSHQYTQLIHGHCDLGTGRLKPKYNEIHTEI